MASSSLEQYLLKNALIDFQAALHSFVPLRMYREFYTQVRIKEAIQQERRKSLEEFMTKIADLPSQKINELVKEINDGIDECISNYLAKNEEHKKLSESHLTKVLGFLCEEYQCAVSTQLECDPYIELKCLKRILEDERKVVKGHFQSSLFGPDDFKEIHQKNLEDRLEALEKNVLKTQEDFLDGPVKEEEIRFEEMRENVIQLLNSEEFSESGADQGKRAKILLDLKFYVGTRERFSRKEYQQIQSKLLEKLHQFEKPTNFGDTQEFANNLKRSHLLDCFIVREVDDRKYVALQVRKLYDKEINSYLEVFDSMTLDLFEQVHSQTVRKLIEESGMIMNPTTGKTVPEDSKGWIVTLENELNDAFVKYKKKAESLLEQRRKQKEKMKQQKREKDLQLFNECLPIAITQVKTMVPTFSKYWIATDDFNPQTVHNFKNIYDHCLQEILEYNYEKIIASYILNDFRSQVHAGCSKDCRSFLSLAFKPVCKFSEEIKWQLDRCAYFPPEKFAEIASLARSASLTKEMKKFNVIYEITSSAIDKILDYYTAMNVAVMESEKNLRETVGLQMKSFYNEKMKGFLKKHGPFTRSQFEQIHTELVSQLIDWSERIVNPSRTTGNVLPEVALKWLEVLLDELCDIYKGHKIANEMKLRGLVTQARMLSTARFEEYENKMKEILQSNPDGHDHDPNKLERDHKALLVKLTNSFALDIRKTLRESEPTEGHCDNLTHRILQHWSQVKATNETNLAGTLSGIQNIRKDREK